MHDIVVAIVLISALGRVAAFQPSARNHSMEQERDNVSIFRRHVTMWETGDLSAFDSIIAPDYIGHVATGSPFPRYITVGFWLIIFAQRILKFSNACFGARLYRSLGGDSSDSTTQPQGVTSLLL